MLSRRLTSLVVGSGLMLCVTGTAQASLITSAGGIGSPTVIGFQQFDIGSYTFTSGPTQVGGLVGEDVVFTAVGPYPGLGGGGYGLGNNGYWTDPLGPGGRDGFAFINNGGTSMTFTFNDSPVNTVGAFMNYCPGCSGGVARIEALDGNGLVLEGYDIETLAPISTPGGVNAGAFRGISRATDDIAAFRLLGRITVADDLTFARASVAVPEPAGLALFGAGLFGLGALRRMRRRG